MLSFESDSIPPRCFSYLKSRVGLFFGGGGVILALTLQVWKQHNYQGRRCTAIYSMVFRNLLLKNKIFSSRQPHQDVVFDVSGNNSVPIFWVCLWLGRTKTDDDDDDEFCFCLTSSAP
jgi:hypothetical protein